MAEPPRIVLRGGDITAEEVDAVVNAANSSLMGGGGVDGAIHRAGGPEILEECRRIRAERYPDGLPTGAAVATTAGHLPARWVIHTVGPVYDAADDPAGLLRAAHDASVRVAAEIGAATVAFPAISCGVYGYPPEEAAPIALETALTSGSALQEVRFVLFGDDMLAIWREAAARLGLER